MRTIFLFAFTLLLACTTAFSQNNRRPFHDPAARRSAPTAPNKVASHDDFPTLLYAFDWDTLGSAWDSTARNTYTYLPNGDLVEGYSEQYNGTFFEPYTRQRNTYSGLTTTSITEQWNGAAWQNISKFENSTDNFGNGTLSLYYFWNTTQWDTTFGNRSTYQYVLTDKVAQSTIEAWNQNTRQWDIAYLEQYSWPNTAGWDTVVYSSWNGSGWDLSERFVDVTWYDLQNFLPYTARNQVYNAPLWEDVERLTGTYGTYGSGDLLTEEWNGVSWDSIYRDVTTNDSHGHEISYEGYDWNGSWMLSYRTMQQYTYDVQGHTTEVIYLQDNNGTMENYYREVYPSFFTSAAVPQPIATSVTAYPNPCTDRLNFKVELKQNGPVQIALYDLQGRLRMETLTPAQVGKDISLSISEFLENGSYVYRIATKDAQGSGTVVVQR